MISISGGDSDCLFSQIQARSEQTSFFSSLLSNGVFGSRHTYDFVGSESGFTLLLLNWKSNFN